MSTHRYYIGISWSTDDQCWIADVPDLRPCAAHGATPSEALAEAEIAIELWLEVALDQNLPIPVPHYRPPTYAVG